MQKKKRNKKRNKLKTGTALLLAVLAVCFMQGAYRAEAAHSDKTAGIEENVNIEEGAVSGKAMEAVGEAIYHHSHDGDDKQGGSCFQPVYHTHDDGCHHIISGTCNVRLKHMSKNYRVGPSWCSCHGNVNVDGAEVTWHHDQCGAGDIGGKVTWLTYHGPEEATKPWSHSYQQDSIVCGKTRETVESYEKNCGFEEGEETGRLTVYGNLTEWTTKAVLRGQYQAKEGVVFAEAPFIWNENAAQSADTIEITENGVYTCRLNLSGEGKEDSRAVIAVKNIDTTAPEIAIQNQPAGWSNTEFKIYLSATDLQPDGEEGCGLAEKPWRVDEGEWTEQNWLLAEENRTYKVTVRDRLSNERTLSLKVDNLDRTAPEIIEVVYDDAKNLADTKLSVLARDLQPDGTAGSGLASQAYSFDGGNHWQEASFCTVTQNGTYQVAVKDAVGNTEVREVEINNLDKEPPEVFLTGIPGVWKRGPAYIQVKAEDKGIGLAEKPYSFDGGKSFTAKDSMEISGEGTYRVLVEDANGNRAEKQIVMKKDRTQDGGKEDQEPESIGESREEPEEAEETQTENAEKEKNGHIEETEKPEEKESFFSGKAVSRLVGKKEEEKTIVKTAAGVELNSREEEKKKEKDNDRGGKLQSIKESGKKDGKEKEEGKSLFDWRMFWESPPVKAAASVAAGAALLSVTAAFLYVSLLSVKVFNDKGNGELIYLGRLYIRRREDWFYAILPGKWKDISYTDRYLLKLGKGFLFLYRGKEFLLEDERSGEKCSAMAETKMKFRMR